MVTFILLAVVTTTNTGFFASIPAGAWAIIGTAMGTIGLKLVEWNLSKQSRHLSERQSLYVEISDLRNRLDKVEEEVDRWRDRYYREHEHADVLRAFLISLGETPPDRK